MSELRQKQELCDIIISVDGRKFHAHKVVLAGCSPYLRAMFTNGMLETDKNTVSLTPAQGRTRLKTQLSIKCHMWSGLIGLERRSGYSHFMHDFAVW